MRRVWMAVGIGAAFAVGYVLYDFIEWWFFLQ